jgi:hypothetical protein
MNTLSIIGMMIVTKKRKEVRVNKIKYNEEVTALKRKPYFKGVNRHGRGS